MNTTFLGGCSKPRAVEVGVAFQSRSGRGGGMFWNSTWQILIRRVASNKPAAGGGGGGTYFCQLCIATPHLGRRNCSVAA